MQMCISRYQIKIYGIVQGIGFRPHVFRLAREYGLTGWIQNNSTGVIIEAEGPEVRLKRFIQAVIEEPPPLAVIRSWEAKPVEVRGSDQFCIIASDDQKDKAVMISPDIALCEDCRQEVLNRSDRRCGYPFTNCTNCGPRYTIIQDVPYDRAKTTMSGFPMCPDCQKEYENPLHRRFHAQPNACPVCGPQIFLTDGQGNKVEKDPRELLKAGNIIAVKGLGGFHLAADASIRQAVTRLRKRKKRDKKPFAVMVRDIETARKHCMINLEEERWLLSRQAPIVILNRLEDSALAGDEIHPGLDTLGVMLPYTPLHYLLFDHELEILIMTSANISDEPLIIDNDEAVEKLNEVADYFLLHDREIYNPCDDSVMRVNSQNTAQMFRRARGFVPAGITIPVLTEPVLAVGGEMKNTFCITRKGDAFLSQHWGDLNHYNNYVNFQAGVSRFKQMLNVEPLIIAHDMHPDYQTSRWARGQKDIRKLAIQHHHAHMASAMAENQLQEEVLGLICDGTGWGTDGAIWGGEIFRGDYCGFTRLAHLKYMPLPGGDVTADRPYRMALVYLYRTLGDKGLRLAEELLPDLTREESELIIRRLDNGKEPLTSSCGRLFDAVSAILGICTVNRYEGQAPAELEAAADKYEIDHYAYQLEKEEGIWLMDVLPMWQDLLPDIENYQNRGRIAKKVHLTLAEMFKDTLLKIREAEGINQVVLSGGVFNNQLLLTRVYELLSGQGFAVYYNQLVPSGDGGISLGQAMIASEVIK